MAVDRCSFCGRTRKEVNLLINGMSGYICDICVEQAHLIVNEEVKKKGNFSISDVHLLKPAEIKAFLDQYVIGQDDAKKYLSVAEFLQYQMFSMPLLQKDTIVIKCQY